MLKWLKEKLTGEKSDWQRVQQLPGTTFPFPKGARLRPEEEVILAFPVAVISENETIGSVLLCEDNAGLTLNDKVGAWYVKLEAGMTFSLAKSSEVMLVGEGSRPRFFNYLPPDETRSGK